MRIDAYTHFFPKKFFDRMLEMAGDYKDKSTFANLKSTLGEARRPANYLAIPPVLFETVVEGLGSAGIAKHARGIVEKPFVRMDYTEAIRILEGSKQKFEYPVKWGTDLQSEHERYLAEKHVGGPVILMNYPKEIKAFYMRMNDDGKTVAAMDAGHGLERGGLTEPGRKRGRGVLGSSFEDGSEFLASLVVEGVSHCSIILLDEREVGSPRWRPC